MKTVDALLASYSADDRVGIIVSPFVRRSDNASTLATKLLGAVAYVAASMSRYQRCVLTTHLRDLADLCEQELTLVRS